MVEFLAYSGMRVGEAREVRFEDVNLEVGSVLITGDELGTKNHQERVIPLFPNLRNLLVRLIEARDSTDMSARIFEIASPRGAMKLACKRAGLKQFSVHSLRHFFASNAIENGIKCRLGMARTFRRRNFGRQDLRPSPRGIQHRNGREDVL